MTINTLKMICGDRGFIDNSPYSTKSFISLLLFDYISKSEIPNTIVIDLNLLTNNVEEIEFYEDVESNEIPFYIPEFGDEFQAWDYENYLFEINTPQEEAGYISFIPLTQGGYIIKRKWFIEDSVQRKETLYNETMKIDNFEEFIKNRFGVTGKKLPSFQRIRYDVNFESLITGHVFGVYFDYSYLHSDKTKVLCQCELEYIRTRSIKEIDENEMLEQFNDLANYMDSFFAKRDIKTNRGVYSKLSFLQTVSKENAYE